MKNYTQLKENRLTARHIYYLAVDYFVIEVRMIDLIVVVHDCLLCIFSFPSLQSAVWAIANTYFRKLILFQSHASKHFTLF